MLRFPQHRSLAAGKDVLKQGLEIAIEIDSVFAESLDTGREIRTEDGQVFLGDGPALGAEILDDPTHVDDILQDDCRRQQIVVPESGVNLAISEMNRLLSADFPENAICQIP